MRLSPEALGIDDGLIVAHPDLAVRVRSWRPDDAPALARAANFAEVARWLRDRFPHPYGEDDARFFLSTVVPAWIGVVHAIEIDGEVAGGIGIEPGADVYRIAGELGYWLTPARWRLGLMPRVLAAYVPAMARRLALRRVLAKVYAGNVASMRVLERSGFEHEGVHRDAVIKHGEVLDVTVYARLFPEGG